MPAPKGGGTDDLLPISLRPRRAPDRRAPAAAHAAAARPSRGPAMRRERFDTPGTLRLDLSVPAGQIDVRTQDGAETSVELEPLRTNDASREAVESARIQLRDRGTDEHELVVDVPEPRGLGIFSRGAEARLVV